MDFKKLFDKQPKRNPFDEILTRYCVKLTNFCEKNLYERGPLFDKYITHYLISKLRKHIAGHLNRSNIYGIELAVSNDVLVISLKGSIVAIVYQVAVETCYIGALPKYSPLFLDTFQCIQENIFSNKLNDHLVKQIPIEWGQHDIFKRNALYESGVLSKGFVRPPIDFEHELVGPSAIGYLNDIDFSKTFKHHVFTHLDLNRHNFSFKNVSRFLFGSVVLNRGEVVVNRKTIVVYCTHQAGVGNRLIEQNICVHKVGSKLRKCSDKCDGSFGCQKIAPVNFNLFVLLWELLNIRDAEDATLDIFEMIFECSQKDILYSSIRFDHDHGNELLDRTSVDESKNKHQLPHYKHNNIDVFQFVGFDDNEQKRTFIRIIALILKQCVYNIGLFSSIPFLRLNSESIDKPNVMNLTVLPKGRQCVFTSYVKNSHTTSPASDAIEEPDFKKGAATAKTT